MEQYIADKKVLGVTQLEDITTPGGAGMVEVLYEDNSKEVMPVARFDIIKTEAISDASTVQKTIKERVGSMLYSILHEYGIMFGEVEGCVDTCVNYANAGLEKSTDILFGKTQKFLPLIEINNILIKHAKESGDGATSTGGGADSEDQK